MQIDNGANVNIVDDSWEGEVESVNRHPCLQVID